MFHMLSVFDLADGTDMAAFKESLIAFTDHLIDVGLLHSLGAIARRSSDTPMDTDQERHQAWMFVSSFEDKEQCDRAYEYVERGEEPCASLHGAMRSKMRNGIFSCWEE